MSSNKAMKQESFFVDEKSHWKKVSQNRIPVEAGSCYLEFQGRLVEVMNVTPFGCAAYLPQRDFPVIQSWFQENPQIEVEFFFNNSKVQNMTLEWVRSGQNPEQPEEMIVAFSVVGEPLNVERIKALEKCSQVMVAQTIYGHELDEISPAFRIFVFQMKDWLEKLKVEVDRLEAAAPMGSFEEAQEYYTSIAQTFSEFLSVSMPPRFAHIPGYLKDIPEDKLKWAMDFARAQVSHLIYGAPFANRAYTKPRGYAGDYEMMNHLYRDEIVGKTLFDRCMHKFFVDEPAGAAVKNRGKYLFEQLTHFVGISFPAKPLKILSLASGPAVEQQMFLNNSARFHGRDIEFTCLDQDEESLQHAQRKLLSAERSVHSGYKFKFVNYAIKNVIVKGFPDDGYDMIYSAGLFDYFSVPVARQTAQKMVDAVIPGGKVIIGNFSKDNSSGAFMELFLDWHLIYRSEEELLKMFEGLGSKIWIEKEPLGVNLFVVIQK